MKRQQKPRHPGYQTSVEFNCDNCNVLCWEKKSQYERKNRHFCSMSCYSIYRKTKLHFTEQHSYKGIRLNGQSKQIYHKRYCKNNPENISHLKSRRYARQKNASGSHTLEEWNDKKVLFDNKCAICGESEKLTKDHIIPLSKGGSDFIENIQPLCKKCNSKKHNKIYENPELLSTDKTKTV